MIYKYLKNEGEVLKEGSLLGTTHIKKVFFSGQTTKRGGGGKPPEPLGKKTLYFYH